MEEFVERDVGGEGVEVGSEGVRGELVGEEAEVVNGWHGKVGEGGCGYNEGGFDGEGEVGQGSAGDLVEESDDAGGGGEMFKGEQGRSAGKV